MRMRSETRCLMIKKLHTKHTAGQRWEHQCQNNSLKQKAKPPNPRFILTYKHTHTDFLIFSAEIHHHVDMWPKLKPNAIFLHLCSQSGFLTLMPLPPPENIVRPEMGFLLHKAAVVCMCPHSAQCTSVCVCVCVRVRFGCSLCDDTHTAAFDTARGSEELGRERGRREARKKATRGNEKWQSATKT